MMTYDMVHQILRKGYHFHIVRYLIKYRRIIINPVLLKEVYYKAWTDDGDWKLEYWNLLLKLGFKDEDCDKIHDKAVEYANSMLIKIIIMRQINEEWNQVMRL